MLLLAIFLQTQANDRLFPHQVCSVPRAQQALCNEDIQVLHYFNGASWFGPYVYEYLKTFTPAGDTIDQVRMLCVREVNETMNASTFRLINAGMLPDKSAPDFYVAEWVDTNTNATLAIEYGSERNDTTNGFKISYFLPVNRIDYYSGPYSALKLAETMIYRAANGSYLYEIWDMKSRELYGIRYYSVNTKQEYKMYFK